MIGATGMSILALTSSLQSFLWDAGGGENQGGRGEAGNPEIWGISAFRLSSTCDPDSTMPRGEEFEKTRDYSEDKSVGKPEGESVSFLFFSSLSVVKLSTSKHFIAMTGLWNNPIWNNEINIKIINIKQNKKVKCNKINECNVMWCNKIKCNKIMTFNTVIKQKAMQ